MLNETDDKVVIEEKNSSIKKESHGFLREVLNFVLLALLIVVPIRIFIAQPFIVSGASMDPTFKTGEYLIVDELSYRFNEPQRGDVIIFKYPKDKTKFFIKRIIGLPEEKISAVNGEVFVNNEKLDENYLIDKDFDDFASNLKSGEYFVMGDNRQESLDSRSWGPLPEDLIRGKAFLRLLPVTRVGVFPGAIEKVVVEKN